MKGLATFLSLLAISAFAVRNDSGHSFLQQPYDTTEYSVGSFSSGGYYGSSNTYDETDKKTGEELE